MGKRRDRRQVIRNPPCILASDHVKLDSALKRMWRNWYTRTFEGRVALPYEFESRHPHLFYPNRTRPYFCLSGAWYGVFLFFIPFLFVYPFPLSSDPALGALNR